VVKDVELPCQVGLSVWTPPGPNWEQR